MSSYNNFYGNIDDHMFSSRMISELFMVIVMAGIIVFYIYMIKGKIHMHIGEPFNY